MKILIIVSLKTKNIGINYTHFLEAIINRYVMYKTTEKNVNDR